MAGFSTWAMPPLSPNPRWSSEITPNPASSHFANADGSLVREPAQPWLWKIIGTF